MERLKRLVVVGAVTAVGALSLGAASASAEPNENACTGQDARFTAQFGKEFDQPFRGVGGAVKASGFEPSAIGPIIRAHNEACHGP